jgi:putative ABC transport system substrate-binding protein
MFLSWLPGAKEMKKKLIALSWALNILFAFFSGYLYFHQHAQMALQAKMSWTKVPARGQRLSNRKYSVAVILPATHKALIEVQHGFEDTIIKKYKLNASFSEYNANGSRPLLLAQIEEVAQQNYDIVFTVGAVVTQLTKEVFSKRGVKIPIVFGAVARPLELGLVESLEKSGNTITGAAAKTNYPLQIDLLLFVKPSIKNALLVYDPSQSSGLEADRLALEKLFALKGVSLKVVEVFNVREVQQKMPLLINQGIDVIMILKDNTVVPAIDLIIRLCERYGITVFVSDLDSVKKGAVLGFGVHEYAFGIDAGECAYKILRDGLSPDQIPLKFTDKFRFSINQNKLKRQGIKLDEKLQQLLEVVDFVHDM